MDPHQNNNSKTSIIQLSVEKPQVSNSQLWLTSLIDGVDLVLPLNKHALQDLISDTLKPRFTLTEPDDVRSDRRRDRKLSQRLTGPLASQR